MDSEWWKTVTPCSKFCINISHLNESETLKIVMSEFFCCEGFSLGHVIITTIINYTSKTETNLIAESTCDVTERTHNRS